MFVELLSYYLEQCPRQIDGGENCGGIEGDIRDLRNRMSVAFWKDEIIFAPHIPCELGSIPGKAPRCTAFLASLQVRRMQASDVEYG